MNLMYFRSGCLWSLRWRPGGRCRWTAVPSSRRGPIRCALRSKRRPGSAAPAAALCLYPTSRSWRWTCPADRLAARKPTAWRVQLRVRCGRSRSTAAAARQRALALPDSFGPVWGCRWRHLAVGSTDRRGSGDRGIRAPSLFWCWMLPPGWRERPAWSIRTGPASRFVRSCPHGRWWRRRWSAWWRRCCRPRRRRCGATGRRWWTARRGMEGTRRGSRPQSKRCALPSYAPAFIYINQLMTPKWHQNDRFLLGCQKVDDVTGSKMTPKWHKNDTKMTRKRH